MDKASALVQLWHDLEAPDGLRVELLDGELVVQANPGHVHDLPGRCLVRHTPEPFEAWSARAAGGGRLSSACRRRDHQR